MARPVNIIPTQKLHLTLPVPIFSKMMLHLSSDVEGRVPYGAYTQFFSELLRQHFEDATLDIGPFLGEGLPGGVYLVRGDPTTVEALKRRILP